jgi:glutathione S-transferase
MNALELSWHSVLVSRIMPRSDTIILTGGYRRIPVLQVRADVYCDSAIIASYLETKVSGARLHPINHRVAARTLAHWADTELMWAVVSLRFQPSNIGAFFKSPEDAEAFAADRAAFLQGATARRLPPDEALPLYQNFLADLNDQLSDGRRFVFGDTWSIADFSMFHMVSFAHTNGAMIDLLTNRAAASSWLERMRRFDRIPGTEMSSDEALMVALRSTPKPLLRSSNIDITIGTCVDVAATDYGIMPSRGELLKCDDCEIVIRREHARIGAVNVHFPRLGFGITRVIA